MASVSVRYIVNDVDAAIAFYTRHLGFAEVMRVERDRGIDIVDDIADTYRRHGLPLSPGPCPHATARWSACRGIPDGSHSP